MLDAIPLQWRAASSVRTNARSCKRADGKNVERSQCTKLAHMPGMADRRDPAQSGNRAYCVR